METTEILETKLNEIIEIETENESVNPPVKKRGRGRPPKNTVSKNDIPDKVETEESLELPLGVVLDIIVKRLPNPVPLSETEKKYIDETGNKVLQKYLGKSKYNDEIALGTVLISVLYPRLIKEKKKENPINETQETKPDNIKE